MKIAEIVPGGDERLARALLSVQRAAYAVEVDIDRLVVDPSAHRQGVGKALVGEVLVSAGERRTVVSTGRANLPARTLYEKLGFGWVADEEVIPGPC